MPHYNSDGYGSHLYVPWWVWDKHKELNFPRGYHIEVGGGYGMPGIGSFTGVVNRVEGYGIPMKQAIRDDYGTSIGLSGRGEMIPNEQSYCEIDPEKKDRWGIPVLRFHWAWSDHELNQVRHMQKTFRAILETMGGQIATGGGRGGGARRRGRRRARARSQADRRRRPVRRDRRRDSPTAPAGQPDNRAAGQRAATRQPIRIGLRSHAAARSFTRSERFAWATIRKTSPLNQFCQAHEVKNLFVADARAVRQQRRQESDAHHHRARVADGRVSRRGNEEGQCLRSHDATCCGGSA